MKRRIRTYLASLLVAATVATPSLTYAMNGAAPLGYGIKSQGMGGVGIALPQDSLASATNPAGMWMVGCRWDVGLGYVFNDICAVTRDVEDVRVQKIKSDEGVWFPEAGINWNFIPCQSLGLAFYNTGGFYSKFGEPLADANLFGSTSVEHNLWTLTPSWSWRISCIHSVGVAFNLAIGTFQAKGLDLIALPIISKYPVDVQNNGKDVALGASVRVGWMGQLTPCFRVGAVFQTKTWMQRFEKYQGLLPREGDGEWPYEAGLGFAWNILPCLVLAFDYKRLWWADRKAWGNTLNGNGGLSVDSGYGSPGGPGAGWNDQSIYKVGLGYTLCGCLTLRAGYNYGRNPVYTTETGINRVTGGVIEHHITVGATYRLCCGEISAYYWHGFENTVHGRDSGAIVDGMQLTNNYDVRNTQNAVGVGYGMCF